MSFSSEIKLRKAVRNALISDVTLVTKLGGAHIYDEAPRGKAGPYVVIAQGETRDWSTMSDEGAEHLLTLEVWSQNSGAREALEISERAAQILQDSSLPMVGATCVHARVISVETLRQNANRFVRARLRLRALVETA